MGPTARCSLYLCQYPKRLYRLAFHTPGHHTTVTSCEATFDEDFLTPCALNQPPFDEAIQLRTLPGASTFPHPYPTHSNKSSSAEEGNYVSLTAEEVSNITMSLDRQFTKPIPEAITYHSQTTSQLTKELKNLIKEDNIHVSYAASTQEFIDITPFVPEPKSIKQILKITD